MDNANYNTKILLLSLLRDSFVLHSHHFSFLVTSTLIQRNNSIFHVQNFLTRIQIELNLNDTII